MSTSKWNSKSRSGRGFSPAEDRGRLPIGELPVDAIFQPNKKRVNFDVERARVGQRTNYDKLVLELWTDGTIRPEEAIGTVGADIDAPSQGCGRSVDEEWFQSIETAASRYEDEPDISAACTTNRLKSWI